LHSGAAPGSPHESSNRSQVPPRAQTLPDFRLLINGGLIEGADTLDVINPATGRVLAAAPRADRAQLEHPVAAAKIAFADWSATPLRARGALLAKLAEALEASSPA
jgi:acyl-CoA reductase-like NAD-dependent aldehyde dehydrogenase